MIRRFCCFLQRGTVLAIATAVSMSAPAQAEFIVSPEAVIIAGDRGSTLSTTLTLSDDQGNFGLKTAVSDVRRSDGAAAIPADTIVIEPAEITIPEDAPAQITITVDLAQASANGEFAGSLYLYHDTGRQVIPLTVRIKEAPGWTWVVMLVGVGLGTLLSIYRVDGRSRDEIVVQVSRLQNQMNSDLELPRDFRASIDSKLVRVSSVIADKDWETAKAEVTGARNRWQRWQEFRDDWIAQLRYAEQLLKQNEKDLEAESTTIFMQGVKYNIDTVYRKLRAGQYEEPQALSQEFSDIRQQLAFYRKGEAAVQTLKQRRQQLPADRQDLWLEELDRLETSLGNSSPDPESRDRWQDLFDKTQTDLEEEIATKNETTTEPSIRGRSGMDMSGIQPVLLVPSISVTATPQQADQAEKNLWWFNQTSRCVAIIFLAWLGMIELYNGKPTFGAEPMRDCFALLAWGFGAELTRESIARTSQSLGVPLGNK